jgi:WD40 repeat protein
LWKWTKRNPSRAAFGAALVILLLTVAGSATLLAVKESKAARDQFAYNQSLLREQSEKDLALRRERTGSARLALDRGLILCEQGDIARGLVAMSAGLPPAIEAEASDVESAIRHNLASWEREMWPLKAIYQGPPDTYVASARIQPRGDLVALALANNTVELWPLAKPPEKQRKPLAHESIVLQLDFSADGRRLLTRTRSSVRLWDAATGAAIGSPIDHESSLVNAAISSDGASVATAAGKPVVRLWDLRTPQRSVKELRQAQPATVIQFRPDGRQLLTSEIAVLRRWSVETGDPLGAPMKHEGTVKSAAYSRDGKWIVSSTLLPVKSSGSMIYLWNADDSKLVFESRFAGGTQPEVLFSPDGQVYAARSIEGAVQLRRTATGELIPGPTAPLGAINSISFSPDSDTLVLGGRNGQLHFWDLKAGAVRGPILYHQSAVSYADFAADGRTFVSLDGAIRRWQIAEGTRRGPPLPHSADVYSLCFSSDGQKLLTGSADGKARVWSTETGQRIAELPGTTGAILAVAFSAKGTRALTAGHDRVARIWDATNWQVAARLDGHVGSILAAAMCPNADLALTGGSDGSARLWDVSTGQPVGAPLEHSAPIRAVAFRPDGRVVLCGCANGIARLWNVTTHAPIGEPLSHRAIEFVGFTPDSRLAITAGRDSEVRLWDSETGRQVGAVPAPNSFCQSVAVSPDNRLILPGGFTSVIHLRLLPNGESVGLPLQHQDAIRAVAFAPDGQTALTGSLDATARRWHVPTGFPVGPAMRSTRMLRVVDFSPDGRLCATGGWDGVASLWVVAPPVEGDAANVQRWAEISSGLALEPDGSVRALDIRAWRERHLETADGISR